MRVVLYDVTVVSYKEGFIMEIRACDFVHAVLFVSGMAAFLYGAAWFFFVYGAEIEEFYAKWLW